MVAKKGTWEYLVVRVVIGLTDPANLSRLGEDRWELIQVRDWADAMEYIFKRERK